MQMNFSEAILTRVVAHYIGNKGNGQELLISKNLFRLPEDQGKALSEGFFSRFNTQADVYSFTHGASLDFNEVYNFCLQTLAEEESFYDNSVKIAAHLFDNTTHPKIKPGELYICFFTGCIVNGAFIDAIGIFKTESKTNFLDIEMNVQASSLEVRKGAEVNKFDKACIVLPTNAENGFDVLIFDSNGNKGEEALFWTDSFLGVSPQATEYRHTKEFLGMAKDFITEQLPHEYAIEKTGQIDLLNKSVEYFRANETLDKAKFAEAVFEDKRVVKAFQEFETNYSELNMLDLPEQFDISTQALKKQARVFKSVLKLDKNFHVYIHGDKSLIEKGYDEHTGKKYYKIYFDEES